MAKYRRGWRDGMVASVSLDTGEPRRVVRAVADGLLRELVRALVSGERAIIENFGAFEALATPEKLGRNFRTGEAVVIPRRWRVKFSPCKELLRRLNR